MFKKLFRTIKNNDGFSLIELIVAFMLLSIFMTAACTLLTNYTKLYTQINTMALGENVAETVMSTIEDSISRSSSVEIDDDKYLVDGTFKDGDRLVYKTPNGNTIILYAFDDSDPDDNGILRLLQSKTFPDPTADDSKKWSLGKEAYMKYRISELNFEKYSKSTGNDAHKNIVYVTMKIRNTQTGSETIRKKLIECYETEEIIEK